jgi:hypothetical protein
MQKKKEANTTGEKTNIAKVVAAITTAKDDHAAVVENGRVTGAGVGKVTTGVDEGPDAGVDAVLPDAAEAAVILAVAAEHVQRIVVAHRGVAMAGGRANAGERQRRRGGSGIGVRMEEMVVVVVEGGRRGGEESSVRGGQGGRGGVVVSGSEHRDGGGWGERV